MIALEQTTGDMEFISYFLWVRLYPFQNMCIVTIFAFVYASIIINIFQSCGIFPVLLHLIYTKDLQFTSFFSDSKSFTN